MCFNDTFCFSVGNFLIWRLYDDLFYCVLSLMHCSNRVIIELMNVSSDALKMRKSRIKGKLREDIFKYIYWD